jgi:F0F1-type ATP synthase membrane subunit b/b'
MWHDPHTYIAISFVLFLLFIGRPLYQKFSNQLAQRSLKIGKDIEAIDALYQEAQGILLDQKKSLAQVEDLVEKLKKDAKDRIKTIETDREQVLKSLEESSVKDLQKEMDNLKEDVKKSIQETLMQQSYENVQWILNNKLTDAQREKLIAEGIEKL